ncbi:alpha/beta hydrolase [Nocardia australiensis]|uniref:alpha/beta hydrolase n=1 Tax=Nocardia australiensis TaxID=2887191 RepID=UPI001D134B4E|nr:alpha/beta hydrolase [Nocardia australiensis]
MSTVDRWKIAVFGVLVVSVPALAGCDASPSGQAYQQPSASAELVAQADAAPTPRLEWGPCDGPGLAGYQCAVANVPLDYAQPNGPTLPLAVLRQAATDPARRVGTLFTAVGGPGGSAFDSARDGELVPGELSRRFDVVTFDQRGIGRSSQVRCFANTDEQQRFWLNSWQPPANAEQERAAERGSRELAAGCAANDGALIAHLTTVDAARDLDLLRRAVGEPKLTYRGGSYASYLGEVYGALFGARVRALQLGAMIDPEAYTNDSSTDIANTAVGTEQVLDEFFRLCTQAGQPRCAFAGEDVRARDRALLDRLRQGAIVVGQGERAVSVSYGEVVQAHAIMLYDAQHGWPALAGLLAELERGADGNADTVREVLAAAPFSFDFLDSFTAITCADGTFGRNPEQWPVTGREFAGTAPTYAEFWLYLRQPCAVWPTPEQGYPQRYTGPWTLRSDVPALLLNNRFDPVTPLTSAKRAQQEMGNARLVVIDDGYGHDPSGDCARRLVEHYLIDLRLPDAGTSCRADRAPFTE